MIRIKQSFQHECDRTGCGETRWREFTIPEGGPYHDPVTPDAWVTLGNKCFCCDAHLGEFVAALPAEVRAYFTSDRLEAAPYNHCPSGFGWPFEWPPPRGEHNDPCWCNGPWGKETEHLNHCRESRDALRRMLDYGKYIPTFAERGGRT